MGQDQGISNEEFASWVVPTTLLQLAAGPMGGLDQAAKEILRRVAVGLIPARAKLIREVLNNTYTDFGPNRLVDQRITLFWTVYPRPLTLGLWQSSYARVILPPSSEQPPHDPGPTFELFSIRFDPDGANELLADLGTSSRFPKPQIEAEPASDKLPVLGMGAPNAAPLPPGKHAGGAPPKDIWEAVWVEMAAALIKGKFDPKRLTDVQNFILDWATTSPEPISESTAKRHAKLLWDKVKSGS